MLVSPHVLIKASVSPRTLVHSTTANCLVVSRCRRWRGCYGQLHCQIYRQ